MKRYIFPLLMFVLLPGVNKTFAQAAKNAGTKNVATHAKPNATEIAQHMASDYAAKLSLTADQNPKVYAICLNFAQTVVSQKNSGKPDARVWKAIHDDFMAKLQGVLTTEQNQKLQSLNTHPRSASTK